MRKLNQCCDCESWEEELHWVTIIDTGDEGFEVQVCEECLDDRIKGENNENRSDSRRYL